MVLRPFANYFSAFQANAMDTTTKFSANQNAHGVLSQELNMSTPVQSREKSPKHGLVQHQILFIGNKHYIVLT